MSVNPEYYYNLSGNITDGKKEYSLYHKEDKIGGLSVSSGLKERYIEYGTDSLLDLVNNLNDKNKKLQAQISCENIYFGYLRVLYDWNKKVEKENKELQYKLKSCEDARQSYKQDWKACSSYCDEYKSQINSLKDKVEDLIEENQDNKAMIDFLDTENNQIMNELKTRTQIQHQLEEENEQLKQKIKLISEILTEDIGYVESFRKIEEALK